MQPISSAFEAIHRATQALRAQIDAEQNSIARRETSPPRAQASSLRVLHSVYSELEHATSTCTREVLRGGQRHFSERQRELERDLRELGADPHAVDAAALHALVLGQHIRRDAARNEAALVGYIAVLEASPFANETAQCTAEELASDADRKAFLAEVDASILDEAELTEAIVGAKHALEGLTTARAAIASGRLDDSLAIALNREAGTHPVPADVREVQAALRAGEQSREAWSYYHARYGERGLRFTRSDSAWLVTLSREAPAIAARQLAWLSRVLAARGMPRLLLEQHLDALHDHLLQLVPERARQYETLHRIAAEMAIERRTLLSDTDADALAREFVVDDTTADTTTRLHIPPLEAGMLIVAAVLDESRGISEAVQSLCQWLDDAARFSSAWREAVARTLLAARAAMQPRLNHD
jgi:hypothetical protein